jgi:AsmA protein
MQYRARRFFLATGGLLVLIVLVTVIVRVFVNSESLKNRIEKSASQVMGMEVRVEGPIRILLLPAPGLRFHDLQVRKDKIEWMNSAGGEVRVRVLPLLRAQIEVESLDLLEPNLRLKRDSEGAFNFIPLRRQDGKEGQILTIRSFRARGATLTFTDQASGKGIEAQNCDWTGRNLKWRSAGSSSSGLNLPDFQGNLKCGKIVHDVMEANGVEAQVFAQDRQLKLSPLTGTLFDGRMKGILESDLSGSPPVHSFELELADFRLERFIETYQREQGVEGSLTFASQLNSSGRLPSEMVASMSGWARLTGAGLVLHGLDLDKQLARYESTQRFNLIDLAAFFVAGPAGLVVTRGYGFAGLFVDAGEKTLIRRLVSEWEIEKGIAVARDVAMSTAENRIALAGGLDFVNSQFKEMRVAVIDAKGCAVVEQRIHGEFEDPKIEKPHFLVALVGPLFDMVKRGVALFREAECKPFYTGRLDSP